MKKKFTFLMAAVMLLMMMSLPGKVVGQTYKKVTTAPSNWSGEYLLVYESSSTANVWTGIDANSGYSVTATISDNTITKPTGAATITLASMTDGYSIYITGGTNNGKYLSGKSGKADMAFGTTPSAHNISITNNAAKIVWPTNSTRWIQTNSGRFRYYASGYQGVQLYKIAYSVTYSPGSGTGSMTDSNSPYFEGTEVTLLSNTFTAPSGYEFDSWLVKDASNNTQTVNNNKFTMPASNVTVTAQWRQTGATQYNVTFADGITGGTVSASPTSAAAGATITLTATPSSGYGFTSWNVYKTEAPNTPVSVTNNSFTMPEYDVTVSATFTAYTVTLDPGNGLVASTSWTIANVNLPNATPPCNTWSFGGWSTSEVTTQTANAPTYVATAYVPTSDTTLYAVYTKTENGVSFNGENGGNFLIYANDGGTNYYAKYFSSGDSGKIPSSTSVNEARTYTFEKLTGEGYGEHDFAIKTTGSSSTTVYLKYGTSGTDLATQASAYKWTITENQSSANGTWRIAASSGSNRGLVFQDNNQGTPSYQFGGYSVNNVDGESYFDVEIGFGTVTYYHSTPDCMETVAMPTFDPEAGTLYETTVVHISTETQGATIYYTTNGDEPTSTPSATNFLYDANNGVTVDRSTTLKAKAFNDGMHESATATAAYTVQHDVVEPTLPASQLFTTDTYSVSITVPENTTVYYTTNGTTPDNNSTVYQAAFNINSTTTVKAIAYDGDGCSSDVVTATYTRAYTLAGAKALYNDSDVNNVVINLVDVQFIAKSGSYTYVQQGTTGLLLYGTNNNSWDNGDVFTAGTVTGKITKYGQNMEMTNFTFSGVEREAGSLTALANNVAITDITGSFSTYEDRYIALTSLTMNLAGLSLSDATNTLAIYDCFDVLDEAIQPDANVVVKGIVTSYYNNSTTTYQIIPLAKTDITTGVAAALPTLAPAGGSTAGDAVETETVTVTPATNTIVTYQFGEDDGEITSATVLTVPSTTATALELVASRDFYSDNAATYYYKTSAPTVDITFYVNGSEDESLAKEVLEGGTLGTLPEVEAPSGYVHMGWAESTISTVQANAPAMVTSETTVNNNMELYAVFAIQTAPAQESYWTKITDLSTVTAGVYTLIDEVGYAFNGSMSSGHGQSTEDAFEFDSNNKATTAPDGTCELTLATSGNGYTMYNSTNGYLYASKAAAGGLAWHNEEDSYWYCGSLYSATNWIYSKDYSGSKAVLRVYNHTFRTYGKNSNDNLYMAKKNDGAPATYADYCTTVSAPSISTVSGTVTIGDGVHAYTLESPITVASTGVLTITGVFANSDPSLLIIENGGQLICNNAVAATVKKNVEGYGGSRGVNGWNFIASPIAANVDPTTVTNLINETPENYDLYRLNMGTEYPSKEWENYKNAVHTDFELVNGMGYLYANADGVDLAFSGDIQPSNTTVTKSGLYEGYNLVGNPFTCNAYLNRSYYTLNSDGSAVEVNVPKTASIAPCTGVIIESSSVTFSKNSLAVESSNNGNIQIALAQNVVTRDESTAKTLDKAIVSFNEDDQLGKFYFGSQDANLYIPMDNEEYAVVSSSAQGEMPVNFKAHRDGQYTITVNPQEVEMGYLHLIDNIGGTDIDLIATPSYTFNAKADDYESRFRLVFSANMVNTDLDDDFAFFSNGQLVIANEGESLLQVIDVNGRIVMTESVNGTCSKAINVKAGVYVLRLIQGTDVKTQKIIVK